MHKTGTERDFSRSMPVDNCRCVGNDSQVSGCD
ncbi:hypothetical protein BN970_05558 [Mycolicibacterium conceptionense]|uniref:Uncharacterized protein n=1 Tax=Mycolicibacterium conceptionense TaxID=451644 RepID=A0A0U1DUM2_9MYCO|nr:hypothetical protein BN970_05558 [Mycolicibacterium conceptionense]